MAMSARLLRPSASLIHPEAKDWSTRVTTNGGSVSGTTLKAVSDFCYAIHNAGMRDRFYRLNLFCGTGLNACLVPLYRSQSLNDAALGETTDTNNGPFVPGDFTETGSGGGLVGDGTTKFLATGITQSALGNTGHASIYHRGTIPHADAAFIRAMNASGSNFVGLDYSTALSSIRGWWGGGDAVAFGGNSGGHWIVTRTASNLVTNYRAGSSVSTNTNTPTLTLGAVGLYVFASNNNGTAASYSSTRMQGYSLGLSMTAAQAASYNTAMVAFQTALARN